MHVIKYIFFISAVSLFVSVIKADTDRNVFVLVIDPGHGGKDPGALGKIGKEKNINLSVGKLLKQYVKEAHPDVKIVCTRETDKFVDLVERTRIANQSGADLFISIHANATEKSAVRGSEVFVLGKAQSENIAVEKRENSAAAYGSGQQDNDWEIYDFTQNKNIEQSAIFAQMVQKRLVDEAERGGRGYDLRQANFLVLRKSTMPRILIELDFITNPDAEKYMLSDKGQRQLARAICNAFTEFKRERDRKTAKQVIETLPVETEQIPDTKDHTVYKIQILASKSEIKNNSYLLKGYKAAFYSEGGWYKYTVGETEDFADIKQQLKEVSKDFKDAFIISFKNGIKQPVE